MREVERGLFESRLSCKLEVLGFFEEMGREDRGDKVAAGETKEELGFIEDAGEEIESELGFFEGTRLGENRRGLRDRSWA